jgi:hypothetical protein
LDGLAPTPSGVSQIEVALDVDGNGILPMPRYGITLFYLLDLDIVRAGEIGLIFSQYGPPPHTVKHT